MSRGRVLSGALIGLLSFAPAAGATTWDVVFTGSGTSSAMYHADERDKADGSCQDAEFDYTESASFSWSYRWTRVQLTGRRSIRDPAGYKSSGTEHVRSSLGDCRSPGGAYDCTSSIKPGFVGSFAYSELVRGRQLFQANALLWGRKPHCTGDSTYEFAGPQPGGAVYNGFVKVDSVLRPGDFSRTHTVTRHVQLTRKLLGAPLHAACSGKTCDLRQCTTTQTHDYEQQCGYTYAWRGVLKLIPRR